MGDINLRDCLVFYTTFLSRPPRSLGGRVRTFAGAEKPSKCEFCRTLP